MEGMREHRSELQATFRERFREETTAHWIERLEQQDLLCAPVRSLADALEDPQTKENGMLVESQNGDEVLRMVGAPIHLSEAPFELRHTPPHLGEHSDAILGELGFDAAAIAKLREDGVLA
jgi:formyl-CoA transferase